MRARRPRRRLTATARTLTRAHALGRGFGAGFRVQLIFVAGKQGRNAFFRALSRALSPEGCRTVRCDFHVFEVA